jgi:hypothetical protein
MSKQKKIYPIIIYVGQPVDYLFIFANDKKSPLFIFAGNDLDSIRALFSEKEKELSLAVAKVEALTRQLEELRRDRRGLSLINNNGNNQQPPSQAARELEKLRRELMVSR